MFTNDSDLEIVVWKTIDFVDFFIRGVTLNVYTRLETGFGYGFLHCLY